MTKLMFFALVLLFLSTNSFAQSGSVKGKVTTNEGKPLLGASITVVGQTTGVAADEEGSFLIKLRPGTYQIKISYVGMEAVIKTITITDGSQLEQVIELTPLVSLTNIIVTGTRSRLGRTNVLSPVPVDVVPLTALTKEIAQIDLNQILTYVAPSFQSSRQTISDGTDHIDPAQLRGLGSDQVLVLVNGKRRHQSALVNVNGTVNRGQVGTDLSALPPTAIEKVEVLRDGAAAQYGSDAIAGVLNVVLKKSTGVLSGNVSYGQNSTSYEKDYALHRIQNKNIGEKKTINDGGTFQAALNYGIDLNKKGFINLSGEYTVRDASNRTGTYTGQVYPLVGGVNRDDSIMAVRGINRNKFDMRIGNSKISGGAFFFNSEYNLSSQWSLNIFGGYSKKNGESAGFYRYPSSIFSGGGSYKTNILNIYPEGFLPLIKSDITDFSVSAGINGMLGKWDASLSNTFGQNTFDYTVDNSINYTQLKITPNPQTKFDAGRISFLQNTVNLDFSRKFDVLHGINLAFGGEFRVDQYGQRAGEEASYKNFDTASKAASGAQVFAGFLPANDGKNIRNSKAIYADAEFDLTKQWLMTTALRFENYSDFGSTLNYKVAGRYKFADWLILRASASTGFRAPSMQQRFYSKTNTLFITQPGGAQVPVEAGTFTNDSKPAQILGIPKLKEETSTNYGVGLALKPAKGLEITIDGYYIKIKDRIILTNNFTGGSDASLTQQLNSAGANTANFFTNAVNTSAKGIEAVLAYSKSFGNHKLKFTFASNFIDNQVEKNDAGNVIVKASPLLVNSGQIANYFNREDQSRFEDASPKYKLSFMVNYRVTKFSAMVRASSFGAVTYLDGAKGFVQNISKNDFTGTTEATDQVYAGKTVTDITLGYDLTKQFTITIGANNLFDVYQDEQAHSANVSLGRFNYSRRVNQMGVNGRYVFARISFSFEK